MQPRGTRSRPSSEEDQKSVRGTDFPPNGFNRSICSSVSQKRLLFVTP